MASQLINTMELQDSFHKLADTWILWAHLPHNIDWTMKSFIHVATLSTVEEVVAVMEALPPSLVENCMLFLMRGHIRPVWEDPKNREGGYFSYKVVNKNVGKAWRDLTYHLVGNTISEDQNFMNCITGITISPKKNFCIIKMMMTNLKHQNPDKVVAVKGLPTQGCLFQKAPEPEFVL